MSVFLETTKGNLVVDVDFKAHRQAAFNFIKLAKLGRYFFCPFFDGKKDVLIKTGVQDYPNSDLGIAVSGIADVTLFDSSMVGETVFGGKNDSRTAETTIARVCFCVDAENRYGSAFKIVLGDTPADDSDVHFASVAEGFRALVDINDATDVVYLLHAHVLHDPFEDPEGLLLHKLDPRPSPSQIAYYMQQDNSSHEASETNIEALALELVGDIKDYKLKPSPTTLFVARLNPITTEESLEIIFARFGPVNKVSIFEGEKSRYAFVEFSEKSSTEAAYLALHESCFIDGHKVVVDFSQSTKKR